MTFAQIILTIAMIGIMIWASIELSSSDKERQRIVGYGLIPVTVITVVLLIMTSVKGNIEAKQEKPPRYEIVVVPDTLYRKIN